MSKKKAKAVAAEHGFELTTKANRDEIMTVLRAAGAAAATGGIRGCFKELGEQGSDEKFASVWELRGPGGMVQVCDFVVSGDQTTEGTRLSMKIGAFKYQKGALPGMKPTFNGSKQINKFNDIVKAQLV